MQNKRVEAPLEHECEIFLDFCEAHHLDGEDKDQLFDMYSRDSIKGASTKAIEDLLLELNNKRVAMLSVINVFKSDFLDDIEQLSSHLKEISELPSRIEQTDEENRLYDMLRIDCIILACEHLLKYYLPGKSPVSRELSEYENDALDGINFINIRHCIEHIAILAFNLSSTLRHKYKNLLQPAPFTWETFEHLGGLMKTSETKWQSILISNVENDVAKRLIDEYLSFETTIEAALLQIVKVDIPKISVMFQYIKKDMNNQLPPSFKLQPVKLLAIKALVRRTIELESFVQLLRCSDNSLSRLDDYEVKKILDEFGNDNQIYGITSDQSRGGYHRNLDLESKLELHAALRR